MEDRSLGWVVLAIVLVVAVVAVVLLVQSTATARVVDDVTGYQVQVVRGGPARIVGAPQRGGFDVPATCALKRGSVCPGAASKAPNCCFQSICTRVSTRGGVTWRCQQ